MRGKFVGIGVALLAISGACDRSSPVGVTAEPSSDANVLTSQAGGASVVHANVSSPSGAGRRILTLHAVQTPSGEVNGGYRIDLTASGLFIEVQATCVTVDGNTGWVGGVITATNSAAIAVGSTSYFHLVDNGKVAEGPTPDVISTASFNDGVGNELIYCAQRFLNRPLITGLEGDLWVR